MVQCTNTRQVTWYARHVVDHEIHPADTSTLTLPQLKALPAKVLRLYLSSRNLITTGNIAAMASRLHSALHQQQSDPSPIASVTSQTAAPPLAQLQQSVRDMVDESLQGLQSRLLESIQAILQKPSGAPANPTPMPSSPEPPELDTTTTLLDHPPPQWQLPFITSAFSRLLAP